MPLDTGIYNSLLRAPKSVAEYDAEAATGQTNRLALQLNQAKLAEHQADQQRTTTRNALLSSFAPGMAAADQGDALIRGGFIDEGRKVIESGAKANKDTREGEKAQREAEKFQFEHARDQIGFVNQIIGSAKDQASYTQGRQAMAARGMDVSAIPEQFDPAYVQSAGAQTLTQLQRLDQVWKEKGFDLDVQKFGEDKRKNVATENLTARGQNMTASTAAAGREQSDRHFNATQAAGKVPAGYRANPDGTMSAIQGGPADLKNNAEFVKAGRDAESVLSLLDEADRLLPKGTSGYIGTGVDKLLGAGGLSTAGAQTTAQLKAIEGALVSKMPKMSGPQSDKDVLLYKQMAGQVGDSTIPVEQRQAASAIIRKLNEKHANRPAPAAARPVQIKDAADYAKIPSGAEYITPDGQTRRKK